MKPHFCTLVTLMIACFVAPLRGSTNPTDLQQTVNPDYLLPTVLTRKFAIEYTGKVLEIPSGTKRLRIWIPAPPSTTVQRIEQLEFTPRSTIHREAKYGNSIAYCP